MVSLCLLGAQNPLIRTDVREVVVPVVVLDKQGHLVEGLKVSDFQVLEDGKPQVQGALNIYSDTMFALNREYLRQMEEIVRATADMPPWRTIIFISDGFNRFAGRELYAILQAHGVKEGIFTQIIGTRSANW